MSDDGIPQGFYVRETLDGEELVAVHHTNLCRGQRDGVADGDDGRV